MHRRNTLCGKDTNKATATFKASRAVHRTAQKIITQRKTFRIKPGISKPPAVTSKNIGLAHDTAPITSSPRVVQHFRKNGAILLRGFAVPAGTSFSLIPASLLANLFRGYCHGKRLRRQDFLSPTTPEPLPMLRSFGNCYRFVQLIVSTAAAANFPFIQSPTSRKNLSRAVIISKCPWPG